MQLGSSPAEGQHSTNGNKSSIQAQGPGPPFVSTSIAVPHTRASQSQSLLSAKQIGDDTIRARKLIKLQGTLEQQPVVVLIDSGSSGNFVNADFILHHRLKTTVDSKPDLITLADGTQHPTLGVASNVRLTISTYSQQLNLSVLPLAGMISFSVCHG
jgi:hypothetical protein